MINKVNRYCGSLPLIKLLLCSCFFFLLQGCHFADKVSEAYEKYSNRTLLKKVLNGWGANKGTNYETLLSGIPTSPYEYPVLYCVVNGECVICIADFLDMVKCFSPIDSVCIIGIAQDENMALIQYYCEELLDKEERENMALIPVRTDVYRELSYNINNVFLVFKNTLIKQFRYTNGRLYE